MLFVCLFARTGSHNNLEPTILLSQLFQCQDFRCGPLSHALRWITFVDYWGRVFTVKLHGAADKGFLSRTEYGSVGKHLERASCTRQRGLPVSSQGWVLWQQAGPASFANTHMALELYTESFWLHPGPREIYKVAGAKDVFIYPHS